MPIQRLINSYRRHRPVAGKGVTPERRASWAAFHAEATMHIERLCDEHRDGDLRQISLRPEEHRLPLGR